MSFLRGEYGENGGGNVNMAETDYQRKEGGEPLPTFRYACVSSANGTLYDEKQDQSHGKNHKEVCSPNCYHEHSVRFVFTALQRVLQLPR